MANDYLWCEKYRPNTISDCVLPERLKDTFQGFINSGKLPNLLLTGTAGIGKTTVAHALVDELGYNKLFINGSLSGNIDTLRTTISNFATTISLNGVRKVVILDESDYLNPQSTQPALRSFMEQYSKNCGFILTANFKNKIIEPLQSRCSGIEFNINKAEKAELAKQFYTRVRGILEAEGVEYDNKVVINLITKHFSDWRRVLNELQRYASNNNKIDVGVLVDVDTGIDELFELTKHLKSKDFSRMRKWVAQHPDYDPVSLFTNLFHNASSFVKPESIPQLVLHLSEYQYKSAFVSDQEINTVACLTEMMTDCEFV